MDKETKRIFLLVLETMKDQNNAIRALEHDIWGQAHTFTDGIADRIDRVAQQGPRSRMPSSKSF